MARPKIENKKIQVNLTINENLCNDLDKYLEQIKLSRSEYIEYLIKKDKKKVD